MRLLQFPILLNWGALDPTPQTGAPLNSRFELKMQSTVRTSGEAENTADPGKTE